jgi:putative transposase
MYQWRKLTPAQRQELLAHRQRGRVPWHAPPHYENRSECYLITAACYEHRPIIGTMTTRMAGFEDALFGTLVSHSRSVFAWVVLPNHYHALIATGKLRALLRELGRLHGRTSFTWNGEDGCRGRHVWHRVAETGMKSERHFWATLNYVLHNAVRHGYVDHWQDWPYSNAVQYLAEVGREEAERRWLEYPILDFGNDWDPPEM